MPSRAGVLGGLGRVTRRYPLQRGYRLIAHDLLPSPRTGTDTIVTTTLRAGPSIVVDVDDFIGRIVFYLGDLDARVSWVCHRLLRPGDTMVDVGANVGVITLLAAQLVGPTGVVHAFEPQPAVASLLERSLQANRFDHVQLHRTALSAADGPVAMHVPPHHLGGASLNRAPEGSAVIEIEARRADAVFAELGLTDVRLLKLDIEGHEPEFLDGAKRFLAAHPPEVILFESNGSALEGDTTPFWELPTVTGLADLGYHFAALGESVTLLRTRLVPVAPGAPSNATDFVALHDSHYRALAPALGL